MTETAKLTASDGASGDYFGNSVAVSGDTLVVGAAGANSKQGKVYVFGAPYGLSPPMLPADTEKIPYNQTITASGGTGTTTLAVSNVKNAIPGLTLPTSGTGSLSITGTPTATGTETFTVTATDSLGTTTSTNYSITVNPAVGLGPATLPADTVNIPYDQKITANGGTGTSTLAVSNIAGAISGLTVPASGTGSLAISGSPTTTGTETFTVTATYSLGSTTSINYSITVNPAVSLGPATLPADTVNTPYTQTIEAGGGTGTVTLAVSNVKGKISGLTVPTGGTGSLKIAGTPKTTGTETFTVTATDSLGSTTSTNYSITVQNKSASSTTLAVSPSTPAFGQTVTLTATVTGDFPGGPPPTGTVTFKDGTKTLGRGTLSTTDGVTTAALTTSDLPVGSQSIMAVYSGDKNYNASHTSPAVVVPVAKAATTTTLSSSANPSTLGQKVTFTVTISVLAPGAGTPTGTVTFLDGTTKLGTGTLKTVKGVTTATFSTSKLSQGSHSIIAQYNGNGYFTGSPSSPALVQVVGPLGSPVAFDPGVATAASPVAAPSLGAASTNGLATDAALRTLLLDDSAVTGKPRSLFES